ncbi:hypothetical protein BCR42DRAFT_407339 [Absidia repens]|uniref:NAD(P)-binding protein n=1 Tax=Absidia repens TaxID=90262 RepID=A0A1X2IS41_9FUNG|nr:hypothetical protein BCR42DRAFT_407339 [Absidia repens]
MTNLQNKTAVLTGAARGIGKAVADALIQKGANVVIGDILDDEGKALVASYNANGKRAAYIHSDATKYKDNVALFQLAEAEFGGVDIAILNAGIISHSNNLFAPFDDSLDEKMMDINMTSVIKGTKVAVLHMARRGGGVIVSTASMAGLYGSTVELAPYTASKHAVVGYTRSFDMLPSVCNVRVNCVCPYWVETDLLSDLKEGSPFDTLVSKSPKTKIKTVVEGFITLLEDETRIGQTLLALPDGLKVHDRPTGYESTAVDPSHVQEYFKEDVGRLKEQLAQALERYEST